MKCVYFSYDGLLDPLGQSQVIPYIRKLCEVGHQFTILSFEKEERSYDDLLRLQKYLESIGVKWFRLTFKSGKLEFVKRLVLGILVLRRLVKLEHPSIVHLRGFIPALFYGLTFLRIPYIYDFRGFAVEEWGDIGKLRVNSPIHKLFRLIDHKAVQNSCGLVVLENSAESLLRMTYKVPAVPLKVIRTCTDVSVYRPHVRRAPLKRNALISFVYLGGARFPYRPDLAIKLLSQIMRSGFECKIDFLNERDHAEIYRAAKDENFPENHIRVMRVLQQDVADFLSNYDCGLVFLDTSPWRRVCSPTKLGEYFAAGLPAISLEGIDILDELAESTDCVSIVKHDELLNGMSLATIQRLVGFIRSPDIGLSCQDLASREFSLERAARLYTELYSEIEAGI